jgi:hypothetical protein
MERLPAEEGSDDYNTHARPRSDACLNSSGVEEASIGTTRTNNSMQWQSRWIGMHHCRERLAIGTTIERDLQVIKDEA